MNTDQDITAEVYVLLKTSLGKHFDSERFPPPVFTKLNCKFIAVDLETATLTVRCPVDKDYLNPFGTLQGGMVAAVVDNVFGPLSNLVAPPSVTRQLEVKYSHPVTVKMGYIDATAKLIERDGRFLHFSAEVRSPEGKLLARAKAVHYILD